MQKVIDLQAFRKVHQPETLVPRDETKDPVDDDLIFDTDDEEEDDDDDDGEGEDLGGFVVADDEVDDGASASEAAAPEVATPGAAKRAKKPQKKPVKKDPKNKGKDKVKSPPRTLAEVRKDAMRNAKSKKQCMCFSHMFFEGAFRPFVHDRECLHPIRYETFAETLDQQCKN